MKKIWFDEAWEDYIYWQQQDKKTLKRINALLKEIERENFKGIGKPEPLKGELSGFWSRRIDDTNRIVYRIVEGRLEILSCKGHYLCCCCLPYQHRACKQTCKDRLLCLQESLSLDFIICCACRFFREKATVTAFR